MAIKRELSTDEFNKVPAEDKSLYSPGEDGKYLFTAENAGELRRAKARISQDLDVISRERDELKKQLDAIEKTKVQTDFEKTIKTGDAKKIDEEWRAKYAKAEQQFSEKFSQLGANIVREKRASLVEKLANELALPEHVHAFKSVLRERFTVELDDDHNAKVIVYDSKGDTTRDTLDDLTADLKNDNNYKRLLKGADYGSGASRTPTPAKLPLFGDQSKPAQGSDLRSSFGNFLNAPPDQLEKMLGKG